MNPHAHAHDHSSHGHHHHPSPPFNRLFLIAAALNGLFVFIEITYAYLAHSNSLLADAGHNLGDVLGLIFSWIATWLLKKQPSERYSYGFKRISIMAAFTNALILVFSTAIIFYEAILKLLTPAPVAANSIIIVAAIGIVINGGTALLFVKGAEQDLNIKATFLHLAYDALLSFGVVLVGILIYFLHIVWLDPVAGILIAVTILWGTFGLMREALNLIMDGVPKNIELLSLKEYFESLPGVVSVHDLHVWGLSTQENALTVHLVMPRISLTDQDRLEIERHLEHHFGIHHVTIQIEQDTCANPCGT